MVIATTFEKRASARLSSWLKKARDTDQCPNWILPHVFDEMCHYWNIDKFKAMFEQAKKTRGSLKGGSLHTRGAKSIGTITREMIMPSKRDFGPPMQTKQRGHPTRRNKNTQEPPISAGPRDCQDLPVTSKVMHVGDMEKVNLASYQLKDITRIWFDQWKPIRGGDAPPLGMRNKMSLFVSWIVPSLKQGRSSGPAPSSTSEPTPRPRNGYKGQKYGSKLQGSVSKWYTPYLGCSKCVDCRNRVIKFQFPNDPVLKWKGSSTLPKVRFISYLKGYLYHVLRVNDYNLKTPSLSSFTIVPEFLEVFLDDLPEVPPNRKIEFGIDNFPNTQDINILPYIMAPPELKDLKEQLKYILDKGFIRPSVFPWVLPSSSYVRKTVHSKCV
ncbi:hypothetical protein MTR67_051306 [Solanum verrucosum]|uniref:Uncharacterized protein n=1 Tax=Solanum verrucosum TaxID=315347 RepID=A0AAF0V703_SOLVR|nr:hypothetical protein MTR67_051306 [Solanum verrucosum]